MHVGGERNTVVFFINGIRHEVGGADSFLSLGSFLRYQVGMTGTKVVCAEGDCGACTVLVSHYRQGQWSRFHSVNSCIAPVYLFDLTSIVTVEGLAKDNCDLSEVQAKMVSFHGGQCGYCTPGIVCSLSQLAEDSQHKGISISRKRAKNYLSGNLCRCTGYDPILNAAENIDLTQWVPLSLRYLQAEMGELCQHLEAQSVKIQSGEKYLALPTTMDEAIEIRYSHHEVRIVSGATDLGVLHNKGKLFLNKVMGIYRLRELFEVEERPEGLWVGANTTLTELEKGTEQIIPELARLLRVFASPQIKNQGTLVGNLINASPIGDTLPALLVLEAKLQLKSTEGERWVELNQFYKGYKKIDLRADEICTGVLIPIPGPDIKAKFYKVSLRKDLDISAVTFAGLFKITDKKIGKARFALGGVGPRVIRLPNVEKEITDKEFCENTFISAGKQAQSVIQPISDLRASSDYRLAVTANLFRKCFHEIAIEEEG